MKAPRKSKTSPPCAGGPTAGRPRRKPGVSRVCTPSLGQCCSPDLGTAAAQVTTRSEQMAMRCVHNEILLPHKNIMTAIVCGNVDKPRGLYVERPQPGTGQALCVLSRVVVGRWADGCGGDVAGTLGEGLERGRLMGTEHVR